MKLEKIKTNIKAKTPRWLSLPFVVLAASFVVMVFYGDNSYIKSIGYQEKINDLKAEIKMNEDSAAYYERKSNELSTDPESLEKIAREQYGMKRENEDVYITDIP